MLDLRYTGSFQQGLHLSAENPIEEVWAQVARLGLSEWVRKLIPAAIPPITKPWEEWGSYGVVRVRQAVEFRGASRTGSLLSRPLPLYYALLNLTRGFLAIEKQVKSKGHGLAFSLKDSLLESSATIQEGTFASFIRARDARFEIGDSLTLRDAISRIPELANDLEVLEPTPYNVLPVTIVAHHSGKVLIDVQSRQRTGEVLTHWAAWFPRLAAEWELSGEGATVFSPVPSADTSSYQAISALCWRSLEVNLVSEHPIWFLIVPPNANLILPRSAYYLAAMFILASAVRYEPELVLSLLGPDSTLGWLSGRFLSAAERYFPQLMLHWVQTLPVFF